MFKIPELLTATAGRFAGDLRSLTVKGISIDSRTIQKGEAFIAIKGDNFDGHDFINEAVKKGASCVIKESSTICHLLPATVVIEVKNTTKALGDIARFQRQKFNIPLIAITGSNGKTTTKEMLAWLLSGKFKVLKNEGTKNNHIGLPLALLNLTAAHEIAVLELGTNHFGEIEALSKICLPNIGIITNIGASHLECFGNLEGVFKEKRALIENLKKPYLSILNYDDHILRRMANSDKKPFVAGISIKRKSDFSAYCVQRKAENLEFLINAKYRFVLNTPGYYNIYNALAAIAAGRIFGLAYGEISRRLADFIFPEGRLKLVTLNKTRFVDDTYNSNPSSLKQALEVLGNIKTKGRKVLVMGDMLELGDRRRFFHSRIGKEIGRYCDVLITVGEFSKLAADMAQACGFDARHIFSCASSLEVRDILFNKLSLKDNDVVLVKGSRAMRMEEVLRV